ncbi:MAG: hypothetical protein KDB53_05170, partial [Planctomycetes bacterium]|nr:hypothetical protein [Planctomycetota bacterium]
MLVGLALAGLMAWAAVPSRLDAGEARVLLAFTSGEAVALPVPAALPRAWSWVAGTMERPSRLFSCLALALCAFGVAWCAWPEGRGAALRALLLVTGLPGLLFAGQRIGSAAPAAALSALALMLLVGGLRVPARRAALVVLFASL